MDVLVQGGADPRETALAAEYVKSLAERAAARGDNAAAIVLINTARLLETVGKR